MPLVDLLFPQGTQNMAGICGYIFVAPIELVDLASLPPVSAVGKLDLVGDIPFVTGGRWYRIFHTEETGKIDFNIVGPINGKSFEHRLEIFIPGASLEQSEFLSEIINSNLLWAARDTDGQYRLLGLQRLDPAAVTTSICMKANVDTGEGTTGQARTDAKGMTLTVKSSAPHAPLFYNGLFPLVPAI